MALVLLLANDAFIAAISMDHRLQITLSAQKKERAVVHLGNTWARIDNLVSLGMELVQEVDDAKAEAVVTLAAEVDPLELMLQQQELENAADTNLQPRLSQLQKRQVRPILEDFKNSQRLDKNSSVLAPRTVVPLSCMNWVNLLWPCPLHR